MGEIICSLKFEVFWTVLNAGGYERETEGLQRVRWDWILRGTLCSSDQPLRKHSVPSGAGTGRLHLEWYQIFENKGMCFPFAADLSTEVLCSGVANVFTRDAERVFLISSSLSLGDFQWLTYCVRRKKECAEEKMRGKLCQYIRA